MEQLGNRSAYQDFCQSLPPKSSSEQPQKPEECQKEACEELPQSTTQSEKSAPASRNTSVVSVRLVAISSRGYRVGETAPGARYTEEDIENVFRLRDEGLSYGMIGRIMDIPKSTVHAIIVGKLRSVLPDHWERRTCRY